MDRNFLEECLRAGMSTRDIEKICDKSRTDISYWIHRYGMEEMMRFKKLDTYTFDKIDTSDKAYTLGFILADGHISPKNDVDVTVGIADKNVCEYIANVLNGRVRYSYKMDKKNRTFPRARVQKRIRDITKFTGGRTKAERHYPRVKEELERYLILGLFDADGCITWGRRKDKNRIWQKISFTSQLGILEGVQKYLYRNLGISSVIRPKGDEKCFVLGFANTEDVVKFCEHIYPNEDFIILDRKYLKYKALRLELEENGERIDKSQHRAEPAEQEGVETNGELATVLNDRNSIQGLCKVS